MSRRIAFFVLAASAALIATQASADPECFGDTCRMPEAVEQPQAAASPDTDESTAPEEANAAVQKPIRAKVLTQAPSAQVPKVERPQVASPKVVTPQMASDPVVRQPLPPAQSFADEASAPREPARLAPRYAAEPRVPVRATNAAPASVARAERVSPPDPAYTGSHTPASGGTVVVVMPGAIPAYRGVPVYMVAPSAKIISVDSDD
jgi:hypothetical protein